MITTTALAAFGPPAKPTNSEPATLTPKRQTLPSPVTNIAPELAPNTDAPIAYEPETPWYKSWKVWLGIVGGVAVISGGGYLILRKK